MEEIRIFNNPDFGDVRIVMIDEEPWFCGRDVATALGYAKPQNAIRDNVDKEDALKQGTPTAGGIQDLLYINESGLYSLIFGSKLDSAKKFKRWVTSEVLPTLRKTGGYRVPQTIPEQIQLLAQGNVELNKRVDTLSDRMDRMEMDLPILPIEADRITAAVQRKGISVLGGKSSPAYKDRSIRGNVYNKLHANLRYNFGVKSYKAIRRSQCDRAVQIINEWKPPVFLADEIELANAQISLNL